MQTIKNLLLIAAVFQMFGLTAQTNLGLRAGINLANASKIQEFNSPDADQKSIIGLNLAVFSELGISELFAIQPEINFLQKGTLIKAKDIEGLTDVSFKVVANYLEVPVLAKLHFGPDKAKAFVMVGPSIGYAVGGKTTYKIEGITTTEKIEFDNDIDDDGMKDQRWDLSAVIGAGGALAAGPGSLLLDLRYGFDFTDFTKFKDAAPTGYDKSYNRVFGISVGYQIPIMK